jgi:hypothetical protein
MTAFSTADIAALTTTEIGAMTSTEFSAFNSTQIAALTTDQIVAMTTAEVHALQTAAIHAMTTDQISAFTTADVVALTTAHIAALTTAHIAYMSTDDIAAMTTAQFVALSTADIVAMTTDQLHNLSGNEIAAFTTAQMQALSTEQITSFSNDTIQSFTTADLHSLSAAQASAFDTSSMTNPQLNALLTATPLILDLTGAGISTTAAAQGVNFDLTGTGQVSKVGWTTATEGFLAIDLNHDGLINNGTELFGSGTLLANGTRAANGYQALAQYDSNGDGFITAADAHFKDIVVWVDANHDGISEAGELKTLTQLGITSIDLHAVTGSTENNGNIVGMTSTYTTSNGATHAMADVWLAKDSTATTTASTPATTTTTTPSLADLLSAPATTLLPGHVETAAVGGSAELHAHAAQLHGLTDNRLLDDEQNRQTPLI